MRLRLPVLAPPALGVLLLMGWWQPTPRPIHGPPAWPSFAHPFGVDYQGRDFVSVLAAGAVDFAQPGLIMVCVLAAGIALRAWLFLHQPVLPTRGEASGAGGLAAASPPRLLLVMVGMLLLEEPSPLFAAAIVTALYLPVALAEVTSRLRDLREQEVLAGVVAHGLPNLRILDRHLLRGYVAEPMARHAAALFTQVAFTQIALSYVFGNSQMTTGLRLSWGMEFHKLVQAIPQRTGFYCPPSDGPCAQAVQFFHCMVLLGASLLLLGGLLRLARPVQGAA